MKYLILVCALFAGCASMSPEQKLAKGFDTVEAGANTATRLLDAELISSDQARRVLTVGTIADQSLKEGERLLTACREAGNSDCDDAVSEINMGAGLLIEIEKFLEDREAQ